MKNYNKLDAVAKLFPSVTNKSNSSVFRVSVVLKEEIKPETLQLAVNMIYERYSLFFLHLRRGVFWNYFDANFVHFTIDEERQSPCSSILSHENRGYIIKVLYYKNRISVEAFHSITDGNGIVEFVKSLLYYYLTILHGELDHQNKVLLFDESERNDEDSFNKHFNKVKRPKHYRNKEYYKESKNSFRIKGKKFKGGGNSVVTANLPLDEVKSYCKSLNCSVTAFFVTSIIFSIYKEKQCKTKSNAPIVIAIPVNLRKLFNSKTLKNFIGVVNVGYEMNEDSDFDSVLISVSNQLKLTNDTDYLGKFSEDKLKLSKSIISRYTPLIVKNMIVPIGFRLKGELKKTMTISNVGKFDFPDDVSKYIEQAEILLYPTVKSPINCTVSSFENKLTISFTRSITDESIIREFFKSIVEMTSIDVEVYSNQWGDKYE